MSGLTRNERKWLNDVAVLVLAKTGVAVFFEYCPRKNATSHKRLSITSDCGFKGRDSFSSSSLSNHTDRQFARKICQGINIHLTIDKGAN